MLNDKVFKFPDGNGGFILKVMSEDGKWHNCDENGKYAEEECCNELPKRQTSKNKQKGSASMVKTSLYLKKSTYK